MLTLNILFLLACKLILFQLVANEIFLIFIYLMFLKKTKTIDILQ